MPDIPSPMSHTQSWGDLTQYTSLPLQGHTSAGLDDFAALLSDFTLPNDVPEDPQLDELYSMAAYHNLSAAQRTLGFSELTPADTATRNRSILKTPCPLSRNYRP